jgi:RimJ/RimL family protein N-acetyltransferase
MLYVADWNGTLFSLASLLVIPLSIVDVTRTTDGPVATSQELYARCVDGHNDSATSTMESPCSYGKRHCPMRWADLCRDTGAISTTYVSSRAFQQLSLRADSDVSEGIRVRRAVPDDTPAMLSITRNVWEGNDYVPYAWKRWLHQTDGGLFVAELDGRVVGLQNIAIQPDGSAWLEGIRVDERIRSQGVGQALLSHGIGWARSMGCRVARLSTSSGNPSSNRIAAKAGFRVAAEFRPLFAPAARTARTTATRLATPDDFDGVWTFLGPAADAVADPIFYTEGWTVHQLTGSRLRLLLATSAVLVYGRPEIEAIAIATCPSNSPDLRLGLLAGTEAGGRELCAELEEGAAVAGLPGVRAMLAGQSSALAAAKAAGYMPPAYRSSMLLHELPLLE